MSLTTDVRSWCWERLRAGEVDDRGWDGWMASPTRWTWVGLTLGVGDGQGGLACCGSRGRRESDMTELLNWTDSYQSLIHWLNKCLENLLKYWARQSWCMSQFWPVNHDDLIISVISNTGSKRRDRQISSLFYAISCLLYQYVKRRCIITTSSTCFLKITIDFIHARSEDFLLLDLSKSITSALNFRPSKLRSAWSLKDCYLL